MRSESRAVRAMPGASRMLSRVAVAVLLCGLAGCGGRTPSYHGGYSGAGHYSAPGPSEDPWRPYTREAASRFGVPEQWVRAVMHQESGGHQYLHGQLTTSSAGAMGLMQVMPATYEGLRQRYGLGADPYDPHDNIMAGTAYIREMYDRFGSPGFLAAYNAGPNRVSDYLAGGGPLPSETVNYVASITPNLGNSGADTGPVAVYADNAPSPAAVAQPAPPEAAPVQVAAAVPVQNGCDPNAAYDPDAPCTRTVATAPAPASVLAYQPDDRANAAYDPNADPGRYASAPQPAPPPALPPTVPKVQLAAVTAGDTPFSPAGFWSVQVGAFSSPGQARAVAESARSVARDLLSGARVEVPTTAPLGSTVLYRARLAGISSNAATQACARLGEQRLPCMVVPPGQVRAQ
jgi:D-alanyl-D-alanine carboxypeptidase